MINDWEKWILENFNLNLDKEPKIKDKIITNTPNKKKIKNINTWSILFFPHSEILISVEKNLKKSNVLYERYLSVEQMEINEISDTLNQIDKKLYKKILPSELIEYGKNTNKYLHFQHILLKNKALEQLISLKLKNGMKISFFERICKNLKEKNNFNSINSIVKGIRKFDENYENEKFEIQYDLENENKKNVIILPFENILSDIAISNNNPNFKDANYIFYNIIKSLINLQEDKEKIDEFYEHSLLREMVSILQIKSKIKKRKIKKGIKYFI